MSEPKGFWDGTCLRCKRRQGWSGLFENRPPCPHCGFKQKPADAKAAAEGLNSILDAARKQAEVSRKAAWDARTPEQQRAYDEGHAAWKPNVHIVDRLKHSPYCGPHLDKDDPVRALQRWFAWGWDAREGEDRKQRGL